MPALNSDWDRGHHNCGFRGLVPPSKWLDDIYVRPRPPRSKSFPIRYSSIISPSTVTQLEMTPTLLGEQPYGGLWSEEPQGIEHEIRAHTWSILILFSHLVSDLRRVWFSHKYCQVTNCTLPTDWPQRNQSFSRQCSLTYVRNSPHFG